MTARFLAGFSLGAMFLVMLLAAFAAEASIPKGGKFEGRAQPASCWFFCSPRK
jgi:hypothetical protein